MRRTDGRYHWIAMLHNSCPELEVRSLIRRRSIAPPGQEGWTRHQEKYREAPLMERTGWWFNFNKSF